MNGIDVDRFVDAGIDCHGAGVLDQAVTELARQVPPEIIGNALCAALPDEFGWCRDCGARMKAKPHKRGGESLGCGALIPLAVLAALAAFWRRLRVRLTAAPTGEDRT